LIPTRLQLPLRLIRISYQLKQLTIMFLVFMVSSHMILDIPMQRISMRVKLLLERIISKLWKVSPKNLIILVHPCLIFISLVP